MLSSLKIYPVMFLRPEVSYLFILQKDKTSLSQHLKSFSTSYFLLNLCCEHSPWPRLSLKSQSRKWQSEKPPSTRNLMSSYPSSWNMKSYLSTKVYNISRCYSLIYSADDNSDTRILSPLKSFFSFAPWVELLSRIRRK